MTAPARRFVLGIAVGVAVAATVLGIWFVFVLPRTSGAVPADHGSAAAAAPAGNEATQAAQAQQQVRAQAQADIPLPPTGQPLRLIHDDLVARAARGDARAACRLASEHERCDGLAQQRRALQVQLDRHQLLIARSDLDESARASLDAQQAKLQAFVDNVDLQLRPCEGATPADAGTRARYWRQAALAGHLPAMRHYASGNAFRFHELMETLPALQTYRGEAEAIATRAAAQGDVPSMLALAVAYADGGGGYRTFLAQSVTPDLPRALAWYRLLEAHPDIRAMPADDPRRRAIADTAATLAAAATADYAQARADTEREYQDAAAEAGRQRELSEDEARELKTLFRQLVKLYHPDRYAHDPERQAIHEQLTQAINQARDQGDIDRLREIARDPNAFLARQGLAGLDFSDDADLTKLRQLYDSLQVRLLATLEELDRLRESHDYELHRLSQQRPELLDQVADAQAETLRAEIATLETEADRLAEEITALTGSPDILTD